MCEVSANNFTFAEIAGNQVKLFASDARASGVLGGAAGRFSFLNE